MGLSSKQVSSDGPHGWSRSLLPKGSRMKKQQPQKQQLDEPLKCPRCDSSNTKFCYYNNYNKSQPRHFCKACKRHWTKGGTLRNVPIGGGRKNKRHKASNGIKTSTATIKSSYMPLPHGVDGFSTASGEVCEVQQSLQRVQYYPRSGFYLPTHGLEFPFSSSFDTTLSSSIYNYDGDSVKDLTITNGCTVSHTWQVPINTSCGTGIGVEDYWNLDDIDALVSTTDLNIPWGDSEIKLP